MSIAPVFPLQIAQGLGPGFSNRSGTSDAAGNVTEDGYQMLEETNINDIASLIRFHLKNILLTCPEERIWLSDFGCCLKQYLFENQELIDEEGIKSSIFEQVETYADYINISFISIAKSDMKLRIAIRYSVDLQGEDSLQDTLDILFDEELLSVPETQEATESQTGNPFEDYQSAFEYPGDPFDDLMDLS